MAKKTVRVGSTGPFIYDDASNKGVWTDGDIEAENFIVAGLTTNKRLVYSDANKNFKEVNDLTQWIAGDASITVTDDTDGTITLAVDSSQIDASQIDHNSLQNYQADEHRVWEVSITQDIHAGNISQASVTQHEAALTITEAQISDLSHYTDEQVDDRVNSLLVGGTNVTLTYDDVGNSLTIDVLSSVASLNDIGNVTISAVATNNIIHWNGSAWINTNTPTFGNTTVAGLTATTATLGNLTSGRVLLAGASGLVEDDSGLTYDGSSLTIDPSADSFTRLHVIRGTGAGQESAEISARNIIYRDDQGAVQSRLDFDQTDYGFRFRQVTLFDAGVDIEGMLTTVGETNLARTDDFDSSTNTGSQLNIRRGSATGDTNIQLQAQDSGGTSNANLILQPFGENVGINTTSPGEALDVNGNIVTSGFVGADNFTAGSTGWQVSYAGDWEGNTGTFRGDVSMAGLTATTATFSGLTTHQGGIDSNGQLHVTVTGNTPAIFQTGISDTQVNWKNNNYEWTLIVDSSDGAFRFYDITSGAERARFNASGQFGIGKTPTEALDVNGKAIFSGKTTHQGGIDINQTNALAEFKSNAGSFGQIEFHEGSDRNAIIQWGAHRSPKRFGFYVGNNGSISEEVVITENGNVGIKTISPTEALDVSGNIKGNGSLLGVSIAASLVNSGVFADGRISQSSVTQHEAALTITESQISDLVHYTDADLEAHIVTTGSFQTLGTGDSVTFGGITSNGNIDLGGNSLNNAGDISSSTALISSIESTSINATPTTEPGAPSNGAIIFVEGISGDLKVKFANGNVFTLQAN